MLRAATTMLCLVFSLVVPAAEHNSAAQDPAIPAGHGIVYLYRPSQFANALIKPGILVDKHEYPILPKGKYLKFVLPEGEHEFDLKLSDHYQGSGAGRIKLKSGETSYLRLDTFNTQVDARTLRRTFLFRPVATEEALPQIALCKGIDLEKGKRYRKGFIADN